MSQQQQQSSSRPFLQSESTPLVVARDVSYESQGTFTTFARANESFKASPSQDRDDAQNQQSSTAGVAVNFDCCSAPQTPATKTMVAGSVININHDGYVRIDENSGEEGETASRKLVDDHQQEEEFNDDDDDDDDDDDIHIPVPASQAGAVDHKTGLAFFLPAIIVCFWTTMTAMSGALIGPETSFILADYYGGGVAGRQKATEFTTTASAIQAIVAFLIVPTYGRLLDNVGRRPFFIFCSIVAVVPVALLYAIPKNPLYYFIASGVQQLFSGAYTFAFLADNYGEKYRSSIFAASMGIPALTAIPSFSYPKIAWETRLIVSIVLLGLRFPVALFVVPESLPKSQRKPMECQHLNPNPIPALRLVLGNKVMRWVIVMLISLLVAMAARGQVGTFYLMNKVGLTIQDTYTMGTEMGVMAPVMLLIVYPLAARFFSNSTLVAVCFFSLIANSISMIFVTEPWMVYTIVVPLLSGMEVGIPALVGVFSGAGDQIEQGKRLAGIEAIMDLVKAFAPLIGGQAFAHLPEDKSWVIFLVSAILLLPGFLIAICMLPRLLRKDTEEVLENRSIAISNKNSCQTFICHMSKSQLHPVPDDEENERRRADLKNQEVDETLFERQESTSA